MSKVNGRDLIVNEELLRLIQPVSDAQLEKLRETLLKDRTKRVIHVWKGFHLDDMEKYKICEELRLDHVFE